MTRDEQRTVCIEAIAEAATISVRRATAALDALHGLAQVLSLEATKDMTYKDLWRVMAAAGDLTNAPEKKR